MVDNGNRSLTLIEAKGTRTPMPDDARSLLRLGAAVKRYRRESCLVHLDAAAAPAPAALRPGVRMAPWNALTAILA